MANRVRVKPERLHPHHRQRCNSAEAWMSEVAATILRHRPRRLRRRNFRTMGKAMGEREQSNYCHAAPHRHFNAGNGNVAEHDNRGQNHGLDKGH